MNMLGVVHTVPNGRLLRRQTLRERQRERVPPGVDPAAYVKAGFLTSIVTGKITSPLINQIESNDLPSASAIELLGTMLGGYSVRSR
jgi:aconitate hydratase 2 / 2-methylisocitrate dehydratase